MEILISSVASDAQVGKDHAVISVQSAYTQYFAFQGWSTVSSTKYTGDFIRQNRRKQEWINFKNDA